MSQLLYIFGISWLAGFTAFIGSTIAYFESSADTEAKQELIYAIVALGGGILIAAVAFALAPTAIHVLGLWTLTITFCAGGVVFSLVDMWISKRSGSKAQFMAMLLDFIPEAISMGAVFGHNKNLGILLGGFIAAQNLPEGFNSYHEMKNAGVSPRDILITLLLISLLGPIAAFTGYYMLTDSEAITAAIMSFASGGILYLIFQDIAPQAKMSNHWKPPLGAVLGFAIGMIGHKLLG